MKADISKIFVYSTVFFCGLSYVLTLLLSPNKYLLNRLDQFIHHRLQLGNQGLHTIGISLFGKDYWFNQTSGVYDFVDSSFLHIAIIYGIVVLVLLVIGFTFLAKKAAIARRYTLCATIFVLMLHSFVEPQLLDLSYDSFLLMLRVHPYGDRYFLKRCVDSLINSISRLSGTS